MTALLKGTQARQIGRLTSVGAVLVALFVTSGCGGAYWQWSKPGGSQQQARQDGFECEQISRQQYIVGTGGMLLGGSEPNFEVWKECLEARGYTVTEGSDSQSSSQDSSQSVSQGNRCVASSATVGTRVKFPNDKIGRITALYGASPRCSDPTIPILVDVEQVAESSVSTPQSQQVSAGGMYDLGVQYANGQGVPQDDVRAYMWYSLAAARLTGVQQRFAADGRDFVASRMIPAQIAEAQRLAQQCRASNYKNCD